MRKETRKQFKKVYEETYAKAYKDAEEEAIQKELNRINKQAKADAQKAAVKNFKYTPADSKGSASIKKVVKGFQKHGKSFAKGAKKLQKVNEKMMNDIMGW